MSMIEEYRFTSGGVAFPLEVGFLPERVIVENKTKWATTATTFRSTYNKGDAAGYAYNEVTDAIGTISTTNGFTVVSGADFDAHKSAISAITQAGPAVVTVASTALFATGDSVRLHGVAGMTEVNGVDYKMTVLTGTTFSLQDSATGENIDSTGFSAYVASTNDFAADLNVERFNEGKYFVTLGTDVVGASDDIMVVKAVEADTYRPLGDIG